VQEIVRAVRSLNSKIDAIQMPLVCIHYYSKKVKVPSVSPLLVSMFFILTEGPEMHNQWKAPDEPTTIEPKQPVETPCRLMDRGGCRPWRFCTPPDHFRRPWRFASSVAPCRPMPSASRDLRCLLRPAEGGAAPGPPPPGEGSSAPGPLPAC